MSDRTKSALPFQIGHVLIIDIVGYSTLLIDEENELVQLLNRIVRGTEQFRKAEAAGKLVRLPTGDGMVLVFYDSPESPVQCAVEISSAARAHPELPIRMGIHSGPISGIVDVNDRSNLAGAGINIAQRIMDCGEAGHILLSKRAADDLAPYRQWQPLLHELGECKVKHGVTVSVVSLHDAEVGNADPPAKLLVSGKPDGFFGGSFGKKIWYGLAAVFVVAGMLMIVLWYWSSSRQAKALAPLKPDLALMSPAPDKSIAVLPFENLSDDKANAYFADGVQEEIITYLCKVADLKVISRTSVLQYKGGAERNLRQIARALNVKDVVEGSVQRIGGRVRVNAQLINAETDAHIWAERYDRDLVDVFAIQSEVAEQIVSQLEAKLLPREKAEIEKPPTTDIEAYDLYLRAKALVNAISFTARGKEKLFDAVTLLDKAVARDPSFFAAYCDLAWAHDIIFLFGLDHSAARRALAETAVKEALQLRPESGEAHLTLAHHLYCVLDYDQARAELVIAQRELPNEPLVYTLAGYIDRRQNRWEESVREMQRALELDPRNLAIIQQVALTYQNLRYFPQMKAMLDRGLAIAPDDIDIRIARASVDYDWLGDTKPLREMVASIVAQQPEAAGEVAESWLEVALCDRDAGAARKAIAAMSPAGCRSEGIAFPRGWCEGVAARARGDLGAAHDAFTEARIEAANVLRDQPDYGEMLCALGLIDAGLGRKEEAMREGRRAVELLPVTKDAINGTLVREYLIVLYAWVGEKDLALQELEKVSKMPGWITYGYLHLHPFWDPLRGDPRFEKIVASLAPSPKK